VREGYVIETRIHFVAFDDVVAVVAGAVEIAPLTTTERLRRAQVVLRKIVSALMGLHDLFVSAAAERQRRQVGGRELCTRMASSLLEKGQHLPFH